MTSRKSLKLKVMNPYSYDTKIYPGEAVGLISPITDVIEEISDLFDQNDANIPEPNSD